MNDTQVDVDAFLLKKTSMECIAKAPLEYLT